MSDRPYHHGDLEAALAAAGLDAARADGPDAIALRVLAKRVGVSATAAYRHYPSKEHLVAAVSQLARESLAREMRAAMDAVTDADPVSCAWGRLHACGRAYVDFAVREPNLHAAAFVPCSAPPPRADSPDAWGLHVDALASLEALGEISPDLASAGPVIAWSSVHGLAAILTGTTVPPSIGPEQTIEAVLEGVRRALANRPDGRRRRTPSRARGRMVPR